MAICSEEQMGYASGPTTPQERPRLPSAAGATLKSSANDGFKVAVSIGRLNHYGLARAPRYESQAW